MPILLKFGVTVEILSTHDRLHQKAEKVLFTFVDPQRCRPQCTSCHRCEEVVELIVILVHSCSDI